MLGLYGLVWYIIAVLPAGLLLAPGYVLGQPRLALLASIGGSIFWAAVLVGVLRRFRGGMWALLIPVLIAGFISIEFLGQRRADFIRLRDYNREAIALLQAHDADQIGALVVNAPADITPREPDRRFLLGTEGVLFMDDTLDYAQQFRLNAPGDFAEVEVIAFPAIQGDTGVNVRMHPPPLAGDSLVQRVRNAPLMIVTQFDERDFFPALVGGTALLDDASLPDMPLAVFPEHDYALLDADATFDDDSGNMEIRLAWEAGDPAALKIFVHVHCDDELIAQSDGDPWGNTYPFAAWSADERQIDVRHIRLKNIPSRDCLMVYAGLYREADVTRLEARSAATDTRFPEDRVPLPFTTTEP